MKNLAALSVLAFAGSAFATGSTPVAGGGLIISEILDGTQSGGIPKFVELTNTGASAVDLSSFHIQNFNNGSATSNFGSYNLPAVNLAPGASYVLSYENNDAPGASEFFNVFGFDADNLDQGSFFNGDDVIALLTAPYAGGGVALDLSTVWDQYGVLGVDGSGENWDYVDTRVRRGKNDFSPNGGSFNITNWDNLGANALDGVGAAGLAAAADPGVHTWVPAPGAAALLGLAGFVGTRRRRA